MWEEKNLNHSAPQAPTPANADDDQQEFILNVCYGLKPDYDVLFALRPYQPPSPSGTHLVPPSLWTAPPKGGPTAHQVEAATACIFDIPRPRASGLRDPSRERARSKERVVFAPQVQVVDIASDEGEDAAQAAQSAQVAPPLIAPILPPLPPS